MREIESLAALDTALSRHTPLRGLRLQDLDLRRREAALLRHTDLEGLVVLGGQLSPTLEAHLRAHGALIFPGDPHAPVNPYRARLYSPGELYAGLAPDGYAATADARAWAWSTDARVRGDVFVTMLRAVHDDSMGDALDELLAGRRVVGVMGGHAVARGGAGYRQAAALGHDLARAGLVVLTGGGPGAMEAANLGAFCRAREQLEGAIERLATVPGFQPDVAPWAAVGLAVREGLAPSPGAAVRSVGMPTWFYGHEPPNVFCDGIAKFFSNAVREDGLLARCTAGVVVLPGAAGTVQEVFQAATRMYYARDGQEPAPLVLVGREHWTHGIPVWPALQALGEGRQMGPAVHLVDDAAEAVEVVRSCS